MCDSRTQLSEKSEINQLFVCFLAVSKLIERLLQKGLVARSESSSDRRYQEIKLAAIATKFVPTLAKIADENDENFFSSLSNTERKSLTYILIKLAETQKLNATPIE